MVGASRSETDVLVVGAGPVGLMMACDLLRRGVRCRVIERADAPSQNSKALGILLRTLEIFEDLGVAGKILAKGLKVTGANVYEGKDRLLRVDARSLKVPYAVLSLPQSDTEWLLTERLHDLGGEVERSRELVGFGQEGDGVLAFVEDLRGGSVEEVRAGWLVGCDGAHSRVRHTLGVSFEGSAYEEEFLLADVDLDWDRSHDKAHVWFHQDGVIGAIPIPGSPGWRLISEVDPKEGEEAPQASVELFQELLAERAGDDTTSISNPAWLSNFKISRRMVNRYRGGRVFLMGDAAHIHSPVGGQGMNTGIGDAYNLGWKLALVIKGKAPLKLLDTYEEERMPVARGVLKGTNVGTNLIVSRNPALRYLRDQALTHLLSSSFVQEMLLRKQSQLDVSYRKSSLSRSYKGSPRTRLSDGRAEAPNLKDRLGFRAAPGAGDRAPQARCRRYPDGSETDLFREMEGTKFTLLLFGGPVSSAAGYVRLVEIARRVDALLGDEIKVCILVGGEPQSLGWNGCMLLDTERELHETYGAGAQTLYLIRPDGYIGFRGQPVREDKLLGYLGNLFLLDDAPRELAAPASRQQTTGDPGTSHERSSFHGLYDPEF